MTGLGRLLARFEVVGRPTGKGSKRLVPHKATGRMLLLESGGAYLRDWSRSVVAAAIEWRSESRLGPIAVPVSVELTYWLARPKARIGDSPWVATKPDIDKLDRGVLDALAASGILEDDRYVAELVSRKLYAENWTGVSITIRAVVGPPPLLQQGPDDALPTPDPPAGRGRLPVVGA